MEAKFGDDLDADSLDLVELVMALEEEFGVEVPKKSSTASRPSARPTSSSPRSSGRDQTCRAGASQSQASAWSRPAASARTRSGTGCSDRRPKASGASSTSTPTTGSTIPKEARRTDRFAQFALAAATMALGDSGEPGADPSRGRRHHRDRRRRPRDDRGAGPRLRRQGSPASLALPRPDDDVERRRRRRFDAVRMAGPVRERGDRVRGEHARDRERGPADRLRPLRRGARRRFRGRHDRRSASRASST